MCFLEDEVFFGCLSGGVEICFAKRWQGSFFACRGRMLCRLTKIAAFGVTDR
jgi:hypothetical protein